MRMHLDEGAPRSDCGVHRSDYGLGIDREPMSARLEVTIVNELDVMDEKDSLASSRCRTRSQERRVLTGSLKMPAKPSMDTGR